MDKIQVTASPAYEAFAHYSAGDMLAMVSLTAPYFKPEIRAPIDIVAVIDRSGSMNGVKLELVKQTLRFMIDALQNVDRLSIVTFDDNIRTDLPLTLLTADGKSTAISAVNTIASGGSTDMCGGILEGINELRKRENKADVSSILVFTDGLANVGYSTSSSITKALTDPTFADIQYARKAALPQNSKQSKSEIVPLPCTINTFGYGSDHDPLLLKSIAEKGNGVYFYVEQPNEIPKHFADCLGGLLSTVAQNIVIRIEAGTGVSIKKILTKYATTEIVAGAVYEITFADIQSQENRDILMTIQIPAVPQPFDEFSMAKISISYLSVITKQQIIIPDACVLKIARPMQTDAKVTVNYNIDKQHNRIIAADAMQAATDFGNENKLNQGKEILTNAKKRIQESASAQDQFCQGLVVDLDRCVKGLISKETYQTSGYQQLTTNYVSHYAQRSTNSGWVGQSGYTNLSRATLQKTFNDNDRK